MGEKVGEFCTEFAKRHEEKKAKRDQRAEKAGDKPRMTREERAAYKNTKKNRAVVTDKPEHEIEMAAGASQEITIAILNNTDQTNPADCKITLAGKQSCK